MATQGTNQTYHRPRKRRSHWGVWMFLVIVITLGAVLFVPHLASEANDARHQKTLAPFYATPAGFSQAKPGQVLRTEPMDITVPSGGQAVRILYRSEHQDGTPTVSSGMVFYPAADSNVADRPVVAWAHGTIGLGDSCAPSRSSNPLADMDWLGQMLARGWVVTATDYAGLGTAGTSRYLIGDDEARDVLNSVRAARQLDTKAGQRFALWGHSQGGHAALWSAHEAASYAPELILVGTAAGAPAAELNQLFSQQYDSAGAWIIGPDVTVSWPDVYPELNLADAISDRGLDRAKQISQECVEQSAEGALAREAVGEHYFKTNPMSLPSWQQAASEQTPRALSPKSALLVAQSLSDQVVLSNTTALLVTRFCAAGSNLQTFWINQVTHQQTAIVTGPSVTDWIGERFEGKPMNSSCGQPLPIAPAS